jgi:hypothetical protein
VVVAVGETVMEVTPVAMGVPPQEFAYQFQLALAPREPPYNVSVADSPIHILLNTLFERTLSAATDSDILVTTKLQVEVFPYTSVAVYVIVVLPRGRFTPGV